LKAQHFYLAKHQHIYQAMIALYEVRTPPDVRTVSDELRRFGRLDNVGGVIYLAQLVDQVPTSYHIEWYGRIVERTAIRRQLLHMSGRIASLAVDEGLELEEVIARSEAALLNVMHTQEAREFVPLGTVFDDLYTQYQHIQEHRGEVVGVPSGYRDLDALLGGLQKSDLIVVAGRPGTGKTAFALSLAYQVGTSGGGHSTGIFSLEMSREQLAQRLLAMETGIDTNRLRNGAFRDTELERVIGAMGRLSELPVHIEDSAGLTLAELRAKARRLQAWKGLDLLIIDYLQLAQVPGVHDRVQVVSEIARSLKNLAKDLNIPIIALSQLSRAVESRGSKVPQLSDLRESGEIEQAADVVMFVYREELYDPETEKKGIAEIHIAKHRNGPLAVVPLRFDGKTTRFQNLTRYHNVTGY
jgi:replicative DNA helicase